MDIDKLVKEVSCIQCQLYFSAYEGMLWSVYEGMLWSVNEGML